LLAEFVFISHKNQAFNVLLSKRIYSIVQFKLSDSSGDSPAPPPRKKSFVWRPNPVFRAGTVRHG